MRGNSLWWTYCSSGLLRVILTVHRIAESDGVLQELKSKLGISNGMLKYRQFRVAMQRFGRVDTVYSFRDDDSLSHQLHSLL